MKKNQSLRLGYFIVTLGALFYFYEYFLRISPSVMKPQLMHSFHIDATLFGTLSAFYFYAYTPMQLAVGVIVDKFKLHWVLSLAVLCCTIGTLLMATTHSYTLAAFGRFLQGFGSAFGFVGALKLAAMWLPAERFAFFSGSCASLGFFGAAFGEILLAQMVESLGWRTAIENFAIAGFVFTVVFWIFLRLKPQHDTPLHPMTHGNKEHSLSFKEAFIHLKYIVKQRYIWIAGILSSLMFLPTSVFAALWGIPYLQALHHYSATQAALATSMIFIGWGIGAPIQGYISDYLRNRIKVIGVGALVSCITSLLVLYSATMSFAITCILFIIFGIFSSVQVLTFSMARDLCSPKIAGMAIAFVNTLAMLGGMLFQRGVGQILDWSWSGLMIHGERVYRIQDYEHAVTVIPVCLAISAIIALFIRERGIQKRMDKSMQAQTVSFSQI